MRRHTAIACLGAALLLAASAPGAPALSGADFERVVDFSATVKTLAADAARGTMPTSGRLVMLDATVAEIAVLDAEPARYRVRLDLMSGEWVGTDEVLGYHCYVDFSGPRYAEVIPARAPREPGPGVVVPRLRLLVVALPRSIVTSPLGEKRILLDGLALRVIP
jgi:hypothetical protein